MKTTTSSEFHRKDGPREQAGTGPSRGGGEDMPVVSSRALFGSTNMIGIEHGGSLYRLKITRQGKLILNK